MAAQSIPSLFSLVGALAMACLPMSLKAGNASVNGTTLQYVAVAGEANIVTIGLVAGMYVLQDAGAVVVPAPAQGFVVNTPNEVTISAAGVSVIEVRLGDLNDYCEVTSNVSIAASIQGDDGDDIIIGGAGDDVLRGGTGSDALDGGAGFDIVVVDSNSNVVLTDTTVVIGTETDTLAHVEKVNVRDGSGSNILDASQTTGVSKSISKATTVMTPSSAAAAMMCSGEAPAKTPTSLQMDGAWTQLSTPTKMELGISRVSPRTSRLLRISLGYYSR